MDGLGQECELQPDAQAASWEAFLCEEGPGFEASACGDLDHVRDVSFSLPADNVSADAVGQRRRRGQEFDAQLEDLVDGTPLVEDADFPLTPELNCVAESDVPAPFTPELDDTNATPHSEWGLHDDSDDLNFTFTGLQCELGFGPCVWDVADENSSRQFEQEGCSPPSAIEPRLNTACSDDAFQARYTLKHVVGSTGSVSHDVTLASFSSCTNLPQLAGGFSACVNTVKQLPHCSLHAFQPVHSGHGSMSSTRAFVWQGHTAGMLMAEKQAAAASAPCEEHSLPLPLFRGGMTTIDSDHPGLVRVPRGMRQRRWRRAAGSSQVEVSSPAKGEAHACTDTHRSHESTFGSSCESSMSIRSRMRPRRAAAQLDAPSNSGSSADMWEPPEAKRTKPKASRPDTGTKAKSAALLPLPLHKGRVCGPICGDIRKRKSESGGLKLVANPNGIGCTQCGAELTPVWRAGPLGPKTLCNACGVRYMKYAKKQ